MNKYIDADRLRAEIDKHQNDVNEISQKHGGKNSFRMGRQMEIDLFRRFVDSLQHEQPEVDLEKEIDEIWNPRFNLGWDEHSALSMNHEGFVYIARHFYELGLNARKA